MKKNIRLLPALVEGPQIRALTISKNYSAELMNLPRMWALTQGEGVSWAVLDTGVPRHPDVAYSGYCYDATHSGDSQDRNGHATHVGGIIGGKRPCATVTGVTGIAPKVKLHFIKILDEFGNGNDEWAARGFDEALKMQVDGINASLGAPAAASRNFPKTKAAIARCHAAGIIIVCASGNSGECVGFPAYLPECIAVGAIDLHKEHPAFSNHGPALDFVAPGVDILSAHLNNRYKRMSGTSMAAPQISGVCALILSAHLKEGKITPIGGTGSMIDHLQRIALDLGAQGKDNLYGHGVPIFNGGVSRSAQVQKTWWHKLGGLFGFPIKWG